MKKNIFKKSQTLRNLICSAAVWSVLLSSGVEAVKLLDIELDTSGTNFAHIKLAFLTHPGGEDQGKFQKMKGRVSVGDDDGLLFPCVIYADMASRWRAEQQDAVVPNFLSIKTLLTESMRYAVSKCETEGRADKVAQAEKMLQTLENWQETDATPRHFFKNFDPKLMDKLSFPIQAIDGGWTALKHANPMQLGLQDYTWENGQLIAAQLCGGPASLSNGEAVLGALPCDLAGILTKNLAAYRENVAAKKALQTRVAQHPAQPWSQKEAAALTQHMAQVFDAVHEATEKGKNCTLMTTPYLVIMSQLLRCWNEEHPGVGLQASAIGLSPSVARYLQNRFLLTGTTQEGQLLWMRGSMSPENQVAFQEAEMVFETESHMTPEELCRYVNNFSNTVTKGMVPKAVELSQVQGIDLLIASATFIETQWIEKFDPAQNLSFKLEDGSKITVPFLEGTRTVYCRAINDAKKLYSIPMKEDMWFHILPFDGLSVSESQALDLLDINKSTSGTYRLIMPKFDYESKMNLRPVLEKLSYPIGETFMGSYRIQLIQQCNKIILDEEGARAGATMVATATRGGGGPELIYIDQPYRYAITHQPKGQLPALFLLGAVANPSLKS